MARYGFEGKVALVTGATKGIGQATAVRLAQEGALVGVNYRATGDPRTTMAMIEEIGGKALPVEADMRKPEQVIAMVDEVARKGGRLWLAHVGLDRKCVSSDLLDHGHGRTGVAGRPIVHSDKRTLSRQSNRSRLPDSLGCAGDQGYLAFEIVTYHLSHLFPIRDLIFAFDG